MDGRLRTRLAGLMFLHYLSLGAWAVPLATFLLSSPLQGGLGFTAKQIALIYSTLAVSGILAPMFLGLFADRLFASEKLMAFMYAIATGLLIVVARWCEYQAPLIREAFAAGIDSPEYIATVEQAFWPLLAMMQCVSFLTLMTMTLTNIVSLRNLPDARKSFGSVRLFGTVGWMVAGAIVALLLNPISAQMLWFAAGILVLLIGYCWTLLPHTPPSGRSSTLGELFGFPALMMLRDPSFAIFLGCALGTSIVQQFYSLYANKFLMDLGAPRPAATQTLAQASEVMCMALFPLAFARFTIRQMMVIGLIGWVVRNALFATELMPLVIGVALPLHGVCYTMFFVVGTLYVDRHAPVHLRASAQGVFVFATSGIGALLGNWVSSTVTQAQTSIHGTEWSTVWLVPTAMASVILCVFASTFRGEIPPHGPNESPTVEESEQASANRSAPLSDRATESRDAENQGI